MSAMEITIRLFAITGRQFDHGDDIQGMSSLLRNLSFGANDSEKEPPIEITAVSRTSTNSLLPKSSKATKMHAYHKLKRTLIETTI